MTFQQLSEIKRHCTRRRANRSIEEQSMAYYKDLREFLTALEKANKLRRIARPITKDTELHPIVRWQFRGLEEAERFGFLFERVTGIHGENYRGSVGGAVVAASGGI